MRYLKRYKRNYISPSQKGPENPILHLQVNAPSVFKQVPPFLHGCVEQKLCATTGRIFECWYVKTNMLMNHAIMLVCNPNLMDSFFEEIQERNAASHRPKFSMLSFPQIKPKLLKVKEVHSNMVNQLK